MEQREKRARKFLRKEYGVKNIVQVIPPTNTEWWYATIRGDGNTVFGVEFRERGNDKWTKRELKSN